MSAQVDQVLTTVQLAEYLGISRWTVQSWRLQGKGPTPIKLTASLVVYELEEVERWVRETGWQKPVSA